MVLEEFLQSGLTSTQAKENFEKFGSNEIKLRKKHLWWSALLSQIESPLIYILLIAAVVSVFLGETNNVVAIVLAVVITVSLGFWQEWKAEKTLVSLSRLITSSAKVFRDGKMEKRNTTEVVPGDLVLLTIGTKVPADGILLEAADLSINEAILTGESVPALKSEYGITNSELSKRIEEPDGSSLVVDSSYFVYAGTTVVVGVGKMLVVKTGADTKIGLIGKSIETAKSDQTPMQKQINIIAKTSAAIVALVCLLIFITGVLYGYHLSEIFSFSVALAVAAIPEGLIVTVTVVLALGMQRLSKHKAVVRKLLSTETLGSVTTICVDKTGTLTEGKMRVVEGRTELNEKLIMNNEKLTEKDNLLLKAAILCNDLRDPLEISMMEWATSKFKINNEKFKIEDYREDNPRLDEMPFNHKTKMIATLHPGLLIVSGAPEVVLGQCSMGKGQESRWKKTFEDYARQGNRLVGFATKKLIANSSKRIADDDLKELDWLGIIVYEDSVRLGVKQALRECINSGINIKVITGDYPLTAAAVVDKLEIKAIPYRLNSGDEKLTKIVKDGIIEGEELAQISDEQLAQVVKGIVLFARTSPEQKLKIVKALKANGETVAMMGDGVNDAPALNESDIGIVVRDASDVAKETADIVLLDSDFSAVYAAVRQGRIIFENIKKTVIYLLAHNLSEIILLGVGVAFGLPLPLLTVQILWINVIFEDTIPNLALATEKGENGLMSSSYGIKNRQIIDKAVLQYVAFSSVVSVAIIFSFYLWFLNKGYPIEFVRTIVFIMYGLNAAIYAYSCRSFRKSLFAGNPFDNKYLNIICFFSVGMLFLAVYLPFLRNFLGTSLIPLNTLIYLLVFTFIELILIEGVKIFTLVRNRQ